MKVPDGTTAAVRCPKCKTVFKPNAPAQPAFEVVDEPTPPKPSPRPAAPAKPAPKPARSDDEDFEEVDDDVPVKKKVVAKLELDDEDDRPRKKKRRDDDDEDDDRPRKKKRRDDDDDDDDRPRSKKRSRVDDDDEEDRPRKKKRGRDDDDDRGRGNSFKPAKIGALLLSISFWMYLGTYGILALFILLFWADTVVPEALATITGLIGFGNWIVAGVGIGFCLAGPKKARGVTIAAAIVAGIHLILMFVVFANASDGGGRRTGGGAGSGLGLYQGSMLLFTLMIPALDLMLPALVYDSKLGFKISGELVIPALAGACEIARLILLLVSLKAQAAAAGDKDVGVKTKLGVIGVASICGGAAVIFLLVVVLVIEGKMMKSSKSLLCGTTLLMFIGYALMLVMPALAANETKNALARRAR